MSTNPDLPETHQAIVVTSTSEPLTVKTLPCPKPTPGSAIVRILAANVLSYAREIYNGRGQYPYPTPFVPGATAIGRVAAVGPDATLLTHGDLVHVNIVFSGRDDPTAVFLSGIIEGHTEGSKKLVAGEWRDSTYAEYAKVPLEACTVLHEKRLCGEYNYKIEELAYISTPLVPYGGLRDVGLQPGETVIVAPATGQFGQAGVRVALAMGAKVIAMGRNKSVLESLSRLSSPGRVVTVPITGDVQADTAALKAHGPIDVYFDISPPAASGSTHVKSSIMALSHGARVSLMGGIREDVGVPFTWVMRNNISLKGKWMYERSDIQTLLKMVEVGVFDLRTMGAKVRRFGLQDWDQAFTAAADGGAGDTVVLMP